MKRTVKMSAIALSALLFMGSCEERTQDKAALPLLENIVESVDKGDYKSALDSISALRHRFPKAIKSRERALKLWQEASLQKAQHEVAQTDSALQTTIEAIDKAPTLLEQNMLRNKRDSLKARYDAECGVVRIIRAKQNGK